MSENKKNKPLLAVVIGVAVILVLWILVQAGNTLYSTGNNSGIDTKATTSPANETIGQSNARSKATQYLQALPFSKSGLVKQLEFDGFTKVDAKYAVNVLAIDWNEQAAKKARQYLDTMAFSRSGLIDQLTFDGFSNSEAEHGVTSVGY